MGRPTNNATRCARGIGFRRFVRVWHHEAEPNTPGAATQKQGTELALRFAFVVRPRVCLVVGIGQVLEIQPGIDLGGADIGVAQQLLHGTQVAAALQQMAGKAVAQHVRVHRGAGTGQQAAALEPLPDRLGR